MTDLWGLEGAPGQAAEPIDEGRHFGETPRQTEEAVGCCDRLGLEMGWGRTTGWRLMACAGCKSRWWEKWDAEAKAWTYWGRAEGLDNEVGREHEGR